MNKKIIYILVLLVCVSVVSAYLGDELVTCGDFLCEDSGIYWSNLLGSAGCDGYWIDIGSGLSLVCTAEHNFNTNTSQNVSFEANKLYNVTFEITQFRIITDLELFIYISDSEIEYDGTEVASGSYIFSQIATPTIDGNLTINGKSIGDGGLSWMNINSISVKEIIEPKAYEIDVWVRKDGDIIKEYHQDNWVEKQVTQLIKFLDKFFGVRK